MSLEIPRIESLRVQNYRALRDVEIKPISPLTVFGSGKSTIFDVFAFLSECFAFARLPEMDFAGLAHCGARGR